MSKSLFGQDESGRSAEGGGSYVRVAIEQGVDVTADGLTYAVPEGMSVGVGQRVRVPLGRGNARAAGVVLACTSEAGDLDPAKIKPILEVDVSAPALPGDLIELARWIARYYVCPLGMVFGSITPSAVSKGVGSTTRVEVRLAGEVSGKLPRVQRALVEAAGADGGWVERRVLAERAGAKTLGPVAKLVEAGVFEVRRVDAIVADPVAVAEAASTERLVLTDEQRLALERLIAMGEGGFGVGLLHGVTGSGKTEVYLRLIEHLRGQDPGAGVIVLVPEIALTPQTVGRFQARFSDVAVLHSGLTQAQRNAQWHRVRSGEATVVVGARSAVFAPLARLGLVIVDEEHDGSYKQDQLPRYHARDVAVRRAHMAGALVVLGSATPSLESLHNARVRPSYERLRLTERPAGMRMPRCEVVDLIEERRSRRGIHLISQRLETELRLLIEGAGGVRGQAILLLNRRGYASHIACPDHGCGWVKTCDHCDATLVFHRQDALPRGGVARCHHCGAEQLVPETCPDCGKRVTLFGWGTQRVEDELEQKIPGVRMIRMDSDTMRAHGDYVAALERFGRGEADLLLGTQLVAKGLDFPNVRLVGVVSADTGLHLPDFRAAERTFQLIAQVSGRAGRGAEPGRVIVQTLNPDDPTLGMAMASDYEGFAERELELRGKLGLPPVARMARLVVRHRDLAQCVRLATELTQALEATQQRLGLDVRIRGPMVPPIARLADHHRQQIEVLGSADGSAEGLQRVMTALRNQGRLISNTTLAVDVDPVALL
ncbi:replication restart helicase PriA [Mucisphaera calidilacus]|uniref:Replication restart protein PriA n=1 Tax=Mucisphaera calidilacus TaxID=2527982 RepID=A0A518BUJ7_9BACT|nr:primosomal protein N' [Mucisphaera calidilacus]QDU70658.1 Primosomal protein N' [Mucisphaera calidilacus]